MPEELYGQTIAVELARAGHIALLGMQRYNANMAAGNVAAGNLVAGGAAGLVAPVNTIFQGRFEAAEGEMPPSMTVQNGVVVPMTTANLFHHGPGIHIPGRWDKFEILRFVVAGNGGDGQALNHIQLMSGMLTDHTAYNANVYATARITTALMPYGTETLVPLNAQVTALRIAPTHARGRFKYVLSTSGTTSTSAMNALGVRTRTVYRGRGGLQLLRL